MKVSVRHFLANKENKIKSGCLFCFLFLNCNGLCTKTFTVYSSKVKGYLQKMINPGKTGAILVAGKTGGGGGAYTRPIARSPQTFAQWQCAKEATRSYI